jgi:hypothetical protein
MLWLGTWHLEASRFYIDWVDQYEGADAVDD